MALVRSMNVEGYMLCYADTEHQILSDGGTQVSFNTFVFVTFRSLKSQWSKDRINWIQNKYVNRAPVRES